ncbi:MAG: SDR family oxidoreductase [Ignavibacteriales bacterium]|nr:SDR family oxidoreductase [Ignavibacteriales bacterium]
MSKLSGKIAVVTGGTGGLGRSVVDRLLREDVKVIATYANNKQAMDQLIEENRKSPDLIAEAVDVTSEKSVLSLYERVIATYNRIDILCNLVGGVSAKKFIEDITLDEWNKAITLNLTSCFLMTRGAIPVMKKNKWGRIVNIAAMPAITPEAKRGGYGVSKSGVIALTKTVSEELKEFNDITINAIAPSIILTEQNKSWGSEEDFKKWVTPHQIAEMIIQLCSEDGIAINGQIIQMYGKV